MHICPAKAENYWLFSYPLRITNHLKTQGLKPAAISSVHNSSIEAGLSWVLCWPCSHSSAALAGGRGGARLSWDSWTFSLPTCPLLRPLLHATRGSRKQKAEAADSLRRKAWHRHATISAAFCWFESATGPGQDSQEGASLGSTNRADVNKTDQVCKMHNHLGW